jgi:hypothetical protein
MRSAIPIPSQQPGAARHDLRIRTAAGSAVVALRQQTNQLGPIDEPTEEVPPPAITQTTRCRAGKHKTINLRCR